MIRNNWVIVIFFLTPPIQTVSPSNVVLRQDAAGSAEIANTFTLQMALNCPCLTMNLASECNNLRIVCDINMCYMCFQKAAR